MDIKLNPSFIPKDTLREAAAPRRQGGLGLFFLISLIIFLGSILASLGVFLYGEYVTRSLESKKVSLERARAAFEPALIEELSRLNLRMQKTKEILAGHSALTSFFDLLADTTLTRVRFKSFEYTFAGAGKAVIAMKGEARSFGDIALQSDAFAKTKQIREPAFSSLNLDQGGNVIFDFTASLDDSLLSYDPARLPSSPATTTKITP